VAETFGDWIKNTRATLLDFSNAGEQVKAFTAAVGGAKCFKLIASIYAGYKIGGVPGLHGWGYLNPATDVVSNAISGTTIGDWMNKLGLI
jgi:hypothetical protein